MPLHNKPSTSTSSVVAFPMGTRGFVISLQGTRDQAELPAPRSAPGNPWQLRSGAWPSPEQLLHRDAAFLQDGGDELSQVQPDVWDIYFHVFCNLQDLSQPAGQRGAVGIQQPPCPWLGGTSEDVDDGLCSGQDQTHKAGQIPAQGQAAPAPHPL